MHTNLPTRSLGSSGLEITAVHNHLLRANPATFYMHVGGHGDPAKMAQAIHAALAVSKTPLEPPQTTGAAGSSETPAIDLDTAVLTVNVNYPVVEVRTHLVG